MSKKFTVAHLQRRSWTLTVAWSWESKPRCQKPRCQKSPRTNPCSLLLARKLQAGHRLQTWQKVWQDKKASGLLLGCKGGEGGEGDKEKENKRTQKKHITGSTVHNSESKHNRNKKQTTKGKRETKSDWEKKNGFWNFRPIIMKLRDFWNSRSGMYPPRERFRVRVNRRGSSKSKA